MDANPAPAPPAQNPAPAPAPQPVAEPAPIVEPAPQPVAEPANDVVIDKSEFKWTFYLTFGLIICASIYSIYYHRQALQKLSNPNVNQLRKELDELKATLGKNATKS